MNETLHVTDRDRDLLLALVQKVRLLSQRQVADAFWDGALPNAKRRLKRLAACDLVCPFTVHARATPVLESPLASWRPGDSDPNFGELAYRCQSRWRKRPVRPCTTWLATDKAAQLYGGCCRGELKNPLQATHDLGVTAVWIRLRQVAPEWAEAWRGEDLLAHTRLGEKRPDAFIVNSQEQVVWAIEFGGGYDADRVKSFHLDCYERNLPYQLW